MTPISPLIHLVDEEGRFVEEVEPWAGRFVKEADADIIRDLDERKLLFRAETIEHTYPLCWRCTTPLLYYARSTWFIENCRSRRISGGMSLRRSASTVATDPPRRYFMTK